MRRLVLKRVVYGVDRNPLAVELAKLSLWLHSFTVGAPLSFLDHHLRCGDSLFGAWVADTGDQLAKRGSMMLHQVVDNARGAAAGMARIEELADADISQVRESVEAFEVVEEATAPLRAFLNCWHALLWLPPVADGVPASADRQARAKAVKAAEQQRKSAINAWLDGLCGDPVALAGGAKPKGIPVTVRAVGALLTALREIAGRQKLLHWQPAFPGVWNEWKGMDARGGFDAVIGNPPWVRQEALGGIKDVLKERFETYEGKADLSTFFVEQAVHLVRPGGRVAFVLPNKFFKADYGERLRAFLDASTWIERVVDFGHNRDLFPDADVFPCVLVTRRPAPAENAPTDAAVAVIASDRVDPDRLSATVANLQFPIPLRSLEKSGWVLEPPAGRSLMERMQRDYTRLSDYVGAAPQYGIKTGFNEAFAVDTQTRNTLVSKDAASADLFRPFLRGQDIGRWAPDWKGQWMIALKTSSDQAWPWAGEANAKAAETVFAAAYPAIHSRMNGFRTKLQAREDQGRFWWELRPCAYYGAFDQPKIVYQVIQFYPGYCLETSGRLFNDKGFMLPSTDPFLLAALNSPLMWWYSWRYLPHMKDEALTPLGVKMERLPIAPPTDQARAEAEAIVPRLVQFVQENNDTRAAVLDSLRMQFGVDTPGQKLEDFAGLTSDAFLAEILKRRPKSAGKLKASDLKALRETYNDEAIPIQTRRREARALEKRLAELVNEAYGLTPEEIELMWSTAPPRMPGEK